MQLNPYLTFSGQCEDACKFYAKALGAKIEMMMPYEGSPVADQIPAEWRNKVMHARLTIGDQRLMACDAPPGRAEPMQGFSVTLGVENAAEAERIFAALADGATIRMPIQETFWATRFGMLVDRFGTPWMINCEKGG